MKKCSLIIIALFIAFTAAAQNIVPHIGVGSVLNYNVVATSTGQQIPLTLNIISLNDPMKIKWALPGVGAGSFIIPAKALESGTRMWLEEPAPNVDTQLSDAETIMFISKAMFANLVKNQEFSINKIKFSLKPADTPFVLAGKAIDTYHVTTANGKAEMWIINNPDFPVICKFTGNPSGIDFELSNVKE